MDIKVKNVKEEIVFDKINELIDQLDCCTCSKCKSDIAAYVLNQINPKYVSSEKGALFSKVDIEMTEKANNELLMKIIEGAEKIKKSPRHQ